MIRAWSRDHVASSKREDADAFDTAGVAPPPDAPDPVVTAPVPRGAGAGGALPCRSAAATDPANPFDVRTSA